MPEEKSKIYEVIGRAIADPDFRTALMVDPDKAIREAGYELTDMELESLRQIDLKAATEELGDRLSKGPAQHCPC
jgi:hypothetical protein